MYQAADNSAQRGMDNPDPTPDPAANDRVDEAQRLAELTGMTRDSASTFLEFHSGMRWLRRDPE